MSDIDVYIYICLIWVFCVYIFSMLYHYTMQTSRSHILFELRQAAQKPTARVGREGNRQEGRQQAKAAKRGGRSPAPRHPPPKSPVSICKQKALLLRLTAFSPAKLLLDHGLPPLLLKPALSTTLFINLFEFRYGPDTHRKAVSIASTNLNIIYSSHDVPHRSS